MWGLQKIRDQMNRILVIQSRHLTESEKNMARSIFHDSLKLDDIRIIAHRLVLKDYAISPNGHVYFNVKNWSDDFSKEGLSIQSWLIHELTHVWQIQHGLAVVRKAIVNRRYDYVMQQGKAFLDYGIEQQAQMVQDYFMKKAKGEACESYEQCIPFLKESLSQ